MIRRALTRRQTRDLAVAQRRALSWRRFRKAIVGAVSAGVASTLPQLPALLMGADLASEEGLARLVLVVSSMLVAGALVYRVPNATAPTQPLEPVVEPEVSGA